LLWSKGYERSHGWGRKDIQPDRCTVPRAPPAKCLDVRRSGEAHWPGRDERRRGRVRLEQNLAVCD